MKISIMDTTLRDGEQTSGVSFSESEKLTIARLLLEELKVDRIEIASARVSKGEFRGSQKILDWAKEKGYLDRVEILGFVDGKESLNWIKQSGGRVVNLLCKGSLKHCKQQLKKSPQEHLDNITEVISNAAKMGITVNIYLEDWSNGMRNSSDYVYKMVEGLKDQKVNRIMLPDTLGILNHEETFYFCNEMTSRFPEVKFDYHGHNDYDLGTANVFAAIKAGIDTIHTTLNGLGERAGNVPLSSVIGVVKDHLGYEMSVDEEHLYPVCKLVESFSGVRIPANKPMIGEFVFTQTSGIHADGDNKDNLYHNSIKPERFGRKHQYALGKMSGKANIKKNLEELGIDLDNDSLKKVTERIIELGDKKETVTKEDLPYIIADVLKSEKIETKIKIRNYSLSVAQGLRSVATLSIEIDGKSHESTASGDGQYDAFMNALKKTYADLGKSCPSLIDYSVQIPPGGKTDALVETTITWDHGHHFKTRGLDSDQTIAAIKATIKMLNIIENGNNRNEL
ncbi:MAG: alpha-isopropylmalate synthase regulatory domain-containing protein [Cyclobacteriaceae bacterium]